MNNPAHTAGDFDPMTGLPGGGGIYNSRNFGVYTYAHQNPVKLTDPDGNIVAQIAIGAVVGAGVEIGMQAYGQYKQTGNVSFKQMNWGKVAAGAAGGAVASVVGIGVAGKFLAKGASTLFASAAGGAAGGGSGAFVSQVGSNIAEGKRGMDIGDKVGLATGIGFVSGGVLGFIGAPFVARDMKGAMPGGIAANTAKTTVSETTKKAAAGSAISGEAINRGTMNLLSPPSNQCTPDNPLGE